MLQKSLGIFGLFLVSTFLFVTFAPSTQALYFYLQGTEQKCFIEELPKDTVVNGQYKSEEWNDSAQQYMENPANGIQITVEELPEQHRIINQKGAHLGRFTFTTAESGQHAICFSSNSTGWFTSTVTRLHLDMTLGDTEPDSYEADEKLDGIARKIRELNGRVEEIHREQEYQKRREAEFRDQSESTNGRVVWWTIIQLVVLGVTCAWQMRHLKKFFEAKKLV
ncbi:hypothetical protein K493DRAFT_328510 [Basidiobolus meristosporus CBS 931.73]|uniref:GOLD domain-containing protein n=1 Tax=Basidiobolus meristosporus CBS 931.73 TaxID=1314790 RepID=A0A1Y1YYA1_9FUNG|nr:hypothetical protein K493DRAFT_328510 [Basidiobolus meristosporus CBS 931.73]|eukprot:ORY03001.1 hypothetical protein K493DRAFT_328510 [Basidiobolus meristosporus CBS 931.73]